MALKIIAALVAVAVLLLAAYYLMQNPGLTDGSVSVGGNTIKVEVADTPASQQRGLSGRESLADGAGMLFVFDTDSHWAIWMQDMRFSIDIVWADAAGKVVTVASDVSPDTYHQSFIPKKPARYVLELPAGYAAARGIVEGSDFVL